MVNRNKGLASAGDKWGWNSGDNYVPDWEEEGMTAVAKGSSEWATEITESPRILQGVQGPGGLPKSDSWPMQVWVTEACDWGRIPFLPGDPVLLSSKLPPGTIVPLSPQEGIYESSGNRSAVEAKLMLLAAGSGSAHVQTWKEAQSWGAWCNSPAHHQARWQPELSRTQQPFSDYQAEIAWLQWYKTGVNTLWPPHQSDLPPGTTASWEHRHTHSCKCPPIAALTEQWQNWVPATATTGLQSLNYLLQGPLQKSLSTSDLKEGSLREARVVYQKDHEKRTEFYSWLC